MFLLQAPLHFEVGICIKKYPKTSKWNFRASNIDLLINGRVADYNTL